MNLLALETSTRRISVALAIDGQCRERFADLPNSGSEVVLPWVGELLEEAGIGKQQLDAVAFGAGPGGFTGLRLACGIAQGLGYGLDIPVVPVSTLAALALGAGDGLVWTVLDARMNEVYAAAYRIDGERVTEAAAPVCVAPEGAVPPAPSFAGESGIAVGDGFSAYAERIHVPSGWTVRPNRWPGAQAIARLGHAALMRGAGLAAAQAQPIYVRDKVALTTAERLARGGVR